MRTIKKFLCNFLPKCKKKIENKEKEKFYKQRYVTLHVNPNDYMDIMDLFWNAYTTSEPCFVSAGLCKKYNECLEQNVIDCLCQGYSLKSVCKNSGNIVGAAINTVTTPNSIQGFDQNASECSCKTTAELLRFYNYIHEAPCVFERCHTSIIFETTYIMVAPSDRRKFVAMNLVNESRKLCKDINFSLYRVDCTSARTAKICENFDFHLVWERPYTYFRKSDGTQLYRPPKPHNSIRVYIDFPKLQNKHCVKKSC